ncbi:hypothetical protein P5673_015929 [Acropora cervicornis]|uniref:Uncharacterized protein n=1 Tax=Acropora cervicornis TaxID=6130 RepID=A0AAD9V4X7_ACRCE|nr:hypothetical protein P5673_015929 [Acropora cervicornis]
MLDWRIKGDYDICTPTTIARNGRFGNLPPNTRLGQGMTIIFCLIVIPLTMLARSTGELMGCGIRFIFTKTEVCLLNNELPKE